MNKSAKTILNIVVWGGLLIYLIFAIRLCGREQRAILLQSVNITIKGEGSSKMITKERVAQWLKSGGYGFDSIELHRLHTDSIRVFLESYNSVRSAKIYSDLSGVLNIDIVPRNPVVRFILDDGYDFFYMDDQWILPVARGQSAYVMVVTGDYLPPFDREYAGALVKEDRGEDKNYEKKFGYLLKLINFVERLSQDPFWSAQIVQINLQKKSGSAWREPEIELITRVGEQVVLFGYLENIDQKLEKLLLFYDEALRYEGWQEYGSINLKYDNQIVAKK